MIDPYDEGYESALVGFECCYNPYEPGTTDYSDWQRGFMDAAWDYGE